jgi:hypothetical protein
VQIGRRLQIGATTDAEAIRCFLSEYDRSPGTHRIYQRECERLLLWSLIECGKPLSSLNRQDFEGYLHFLADPQPAALWCGPKVPRVKPQWRPFVGSVVRRGGADRHRRDQFADGLSGRCRLSRGQPARSDPAAAPQAQRRVERERDRDRRT